MVVESSLVTVSLVVVESSLVRVNLVVVESSFVRVVELSLDYVEGFVTRDSMSWGLGLQRRVSFRGGRG